MDANSEQQHEEAPPIGEPPVDAEILEPELEDRVESGVQVAKPAGLVQVGEASLGAWTPSPLALLSDEEFDRRLAMMKVEQGRIAKVKQALLVLDRDYGKIPGTQTPSLFQPGAEAYNRLAHLRPRYRVKREAGDGETAPQIRIEVECELLDENDRIHGTGFGSASFWEKKFRYRSGRLLCPECGSETVFKSKKDPGWFCWASKGGCGAQFKNENDQRIKTQTLGPVENEDPHDLDNTILQYACKRAYVKATRTTHALSNAFTQDVEDMDPRDVQSHASERPARTENQQRNQDQASKPVSDGQLAMLIKRSEERAGELGDESISAGVIAEGVAKAFGVEGLGKLPQSKLAQAVKAIQAWEPGV